MLYFSGVADGALSVHWNDRGWQRFVEMRSRLLVVLQAMGEAAFAEFGRGLIGTQAEIRKVQLLALFAMLYVISEQERLLGREMDPHIEINLLWFCRPHGSRYKVSAS